MAETDNKATLFSPEEWEQIARRIDKDDVKGSVTNSLSWRRRSIRLYKGSRILYEVAKAANDYKMDRFFAEIERGDIQKDGIAMPEEEEIMIREEQIFVAYFLLGRAMETILKAILIEQNPKKYFKSDRENIHFGTKKGHDLLELASECGLIFDDHQIKRLETLNVSILEFIYPSALTVKEQIINRQIVEKTNLRTDIKSYEDYTNILAAMWVRANELVNHRHAQDDK